VTRNASGIRLFQIGSQLAMASSARVVLMGEFLPGLQATRPPRPSARERMAAIACFGNAGSTTNSFETADLVAIVVYGVIGWGLMLIRIITAPRGHKPAMS
jgi:hypothetical protein